jgi:hypothetical protein
MTIEPWDHCLALLQPGSTLYTAMSERRAAGEELPGPVVVFLNSTALPGSLGPQDLVRRKDAPKHFGIRQTSIDELVNSKSIPAPFPLTPGGVATGVAGVHNPIPPAHRTSTRDLRKRAGGRCAAERAADGEGERDAESPGATMNRMKTLSERLDQLRALGVTVDWVERGSKHHLAFVTAPDGRRRMMTINVNDTNWRNLFFWSLKSLFS